MNKADARAILTTKGYIGEYRLSWRSDFVPVLRTDDKGRRLGPAYFGSTKDAELAAWREMNRVEQCAMVRGGVTVTTARAAAELHFKPSKGDRKVVAL